MTSYRELGNYSWETIELYNKFNDLEVAALDSELEGRLPLGVRVRVGGAPPDHLLNDREVPVQTRVVEGDALLLHRLIK